MPFSFKSIIYTILIVGTFIFLCFRADQKPQIGTFIAGKIEGKQSTLPPVGTLESYLDTVILSVTIGGLLVSQNKYRYNLVDILLPNQSHSNIFFLFGFIGYFTVLMIAIISFGKLKIPSRAAITAFLMSLKSSHTPDLVPKSIDRKASVKAHAQSAIVQREINPVLRQIASY